MARYNAASWGKLFYFFSMVYKSVLTIDQVPVLLWSTDRSLQGLTTALHEGHIISRHELHVLLKHAVSISSRNLVLFLQDTLSVDDFTRYTDSSGNEAPFHNVQELLESSSSSLVLPAVDCHAVSYLSDYLQETLNWALVNVDQSNISHLMVDVSKPNIFVVKLPPTRRANHLATQKDLLENDKIIGSFAKTLQQQGTEAITIYTASRPSRVPVRPDVAWQSRRQLMAVEEENRLYAPLNVTNGTDSNHTCILFYATNFTLIANHSVHVNLTEQTFITRNVSTAGSNCTTPNATLILKYSKPVSDIENLEIRFLMTNQFYSGSARNWFTLDSVQILQDDRIVAIFNVAIISGPAEYSFHCQLVGTSSHYGAVLIPTNDEYKNWEVVISDFQIQAYSVENNRFSYASDCTTFFTPAIWMGLVTSLVLLLILTFGIHMIVNLTTNNRFDDRNGPVLSVPQTE